MALLKHKEDNFGNGGYEYFKLIETNINWLNKTAQCSLAGYINKAARDANKKPVEVITFDWNNYNFPFALDILNQENENVIKVAYEKIKESKLDDEGRELNWFASAEDC